MRFDRVTRVGHVGLIFMAVIVIAICVAFLVFEPSLLAFAAAPLFVAGAAYALYRPTHLTYVLRASPQGLSAKPFVGRTVEATWADIAELQRWWAPSKILRTEHLRVVPRNGRSFAITSRMFKSGHETFEAFIASVEQQAPHARRTQPTRLIRFLIG